MDHDRLVQQIYESAEDTRSWEGTIGAVAAHVGSNGGHVFLLGSCGNPLESYGHGYELQNVTAYHAEFQRQDPRLAIARTNPGRVFSDVDVIDPAAFERSALYNELLAGVGARYTLFSSQPCGTDFVLAQAFMRPRSAGPFDAAEVARLQRLEPHLARAVRLRNLLGAMRDEIGDLRRALDHQPVPIAILDAKGTIRCTNERADRLLALGDGVRSRGGRLTGTDAAEAHAIAAALGATAAWADPTQARPATAPAHPPVVEVFRSSGKPLTLIFMPLCPQHELRERAAREARAMVVFHDPDATVRLNPDLIARVHGLTPTEAQLAAAIADGLAPSQIAEARGCSEQTVRTHLKRILDKTGTHRQADLVRLLLGTTALHLARSA